MAQFLQNDVRGWRAALLNAFLLDGHITCISLIRTRSPTSQMIYIVCSFLHAAKNVLQVDHDKKTAEETKKKEEEKKEEEAPPKEQDQQGHLLHPDLQVPFYQ